MRKLWASFLTASLLLTPVNSIAAQAPAKAVAETQEVLGIPDEAGGTGDGAEELLRDAQSRQILQPEIDTCFSLGASGYDIINGTKVVSDGERVVYGMQDGIYVQEGDGEEYLLCTDQARNLNLSDEGILYYTTTRKNDCYIKAIDLKRCVLPGNYRLSGFPVKHMYLVDNSRLLFSADGHIYCLEISDGTLSCELDCKGLFSFIPTRYGILYATGSLFDYTLYAAGNLVVEHVSDYYMEEDTLVYRSDGEEYRLDAGVIFGDDFDAVHIEAAYTDKCFYEYITPEEFQRQIQGVVPAEYEGIRSDTPRHVLYEDTFLFDPVMTFQGVDYGISSSADLRPTPSASASGQLTPAKRTDEQKAIQERAEVIYNDVWRTQGRVRKWGAEDIYIAENKEIHGMIYCQPVNNGRFVLAPGGMSYEEYQRERASADSKLYSGDRQDWAWNSVQENGETVIKYGPKYGCDCSTFASYCWNLDNRHNTWDIINYGTKINDAKLNFLGLQVGDIINKEGDHVIVITDIAYDANGNIGKIETIEQTNPDVKKSVYYSYSEFAQKTKKNKSGKTIPAFDGYYLYRCKSLPVTAALTLSAAEHTLYKGETFQLTAEAFPGGKITWKSGNTSVATVDKNGKVTAKKRGTAVICATLTSDGAPKVQAECRVTVQEKTLTLDKSKVLYMGCSEQLQVTVQPRANIIWRSDDPSIAAVKDGTVTGLRAGTVQIRAAANGMTKICVVKVKNPVLKLSSRSLTVRIGQEKSLTATATPAAAVKWSVDKPKIASVDSDGTVRGLKKGTAKITASAVVNGKTISAVCTVTVKKPDLKINRQTMTVYLGDTGSITATPEPQATVVWSSSNAKVATVDQNGTVTGVKTGTAKITATAHGISKTCQVTVKKPTFSINKTSLKAYQGYTGSITATPRPKAPVSWQSSDPSVASVDQNGTVTGVKTGTVTITATAHGISKTCKVTVQKPTFRISRTSLTVYRGGTGSIAATPQPQVKVLWSSSNTSVATVDSDGVVTGVKAGNATVTATAHGKSLTCRVTVKDPSLKISQSALSIYRGQSKSITATAAPRTTVKWRSSNPLVARVDADGTVTGMNPGTVTITATAHGISKTCTVTVANPTLIVKAVSHTMRRGTSVQIQAQAMPRGMITYLSRDNAVAAVTPQGRIYARNPGTTFIQVSANGVVKKVKVTVIR
ncbi:MAG: Ig-like domain-containing protein [Muribaculum sp.]|nr:Ig-like domain-containing protein [Muribaculum sp.]